MNWTNSDAFRIAHNQRAPKDMFAGASHLDVHEIFLSTDLRSGQTAPSSPSIPSSHHGAPSSPSTQSHKQTTQHTESPKPSSPSLSQLPVMSLAELAKYTDSPKIYVGLMGKVGLAKNDFPNFDGCMHHFQRFLMSLKLLISTDQGKLIIVSQAVTPPRPLRASRWRKRTSQVKTLRT